MSVSLQHPCTRREHHSLCALTSSSPHLRPARYPLSCCLPTTQEGAAGLRPVSLILCRVDGDEAQCTHSRGSEQALFYVLSAYSLACCHAFHFPRGRSEGRRLGTQDGQHVQALSLGQTSF